MYYGIPYLIIFVIIFLLVKFCLISSTKNKEILKDKEIKIQLYISSFAITMSFMLLIVILLEEIFA